MARKGRVGSALGMAAMGSFIAGTVIYSCKLLKGGKNHAKKIQNCKVGFLFVVEFFGAFHFRALNLFMPKIIPSNRSTSSSRSVQGGQNDLLIRMLSPLAPEYFGQPWVVRIRTGGGGAIGSNEVAQADTDGYTLLSGHANCNTRPPGCRRQEQRPGRSGGHCPVEQSIFCLLGPNRSPLENFQRGARLGQGQPRQVDLRQRGHMVQQRLLVEVA